MTATVVLTATEPISETATVAPAPNPAPPSTPEPEITPTPEAPSPPPASPLPPEIADWPQQVLALMNQRRSDNGLMPLGWSPALAQAAQVHAEDCAARDWCSHVGADGSRLRDRLERVGYQAAWSSENWVYASGPEQGVTWWYDEPQGADPHRRNILSQQALEVGVGVAQGQWGLYYIVADFGSP